jgi:hypothetical protein
LSGLIRCSNRLNSDINFCLQACIEGSWPLKIQSFLTTQILQDIMIIMSMEKGTSSFLLMLSMIWVTDLVVTTEIPTEYQHALAKLHLRKRCAADFNFCKMQRSQV